MRHEFAFFSATRQRVCDACKMPNSGIHQRAHISYFFPQKRVQILSLTLPGIIGFQSPMSKLTLEE